MDWDIVVAIHVLHKIAIGSYSQVIIKLLGNVDIQTWDIKI